MNYNYIMNTAKDADGNEIEITAKMNKDGTGLTHEVDAPELEAKLEELTTKGDTTNSLLQTLTDQTTGNGNLLQTLIDQIAITNNVLQEQKTQADAIDNVITFSENITAIEIFHAEDTWQQFAVNGLTLNIPPGGYRTPIAGVAGKTVTIPANIKCIVGRLV